MAIGARSEALLTVDTSVEVPKNKTALPEVNPEGLLSSVIRVDLVTPRGVEHNANLPGRIYRLDV